jgi:adenosylcobinamide-GDP ribazoletransferase
MTDIRAFLLGVQFLTRLPIHMERPEPREIASSYYFYPIVGFLIGTAGVLLLHVLMLAFPLSFAVSLVLAFLIWISGGLHEDGLADVADAMGGGWNREQRLTILKDSRIGAFGASALVLVLIAKYSALTAMSLDRLDVALIIAQILGRWAFLPAGYFNRHAREGIGSEFMKGLNATTVIITTVVSTIAAILLGRTRGVLALAAAIVIIAIASMYFRRRLGGITGDCLGAIFQFVEVATYAVFLA